VQVVGERVAGCREKQTPQFVSVDIADAEGQKR
jgi:hypothetical protein